MSSKIISFKKKIYAYYKKSGRHTLPWRQTHDPYRILISEIMLQQTQVERVLPKYNNFIIQFPTVCTLARATRVEVLHAWSGLGYNRRAVMLQKTAQLICDEYKGIFPTDIKKLKELPGIGPYTANAILAFAFNMPVVMIETNIRSVFLDAFFKKRLPRSVHDDELLSFIRDSLDKTNPRQWYAALMDYGTHLKKEKKNINQRSIHYTKQAPFKGSVREVRGSILKLLIHKTYTESGLQKQNMFSKELIQKALQALKRDGLIEKHQSHWQIVEM